MFLRLVFLFSACAFLTSLPVSSYASCEDSLLAPPRTVQARVKRLNDRLRPQNGVARLLLEALAQDGSPLDFDIYETYLDILDITTGSVHSKSSNGGTRSPFFQRCDWEWKSFVAYFYDSPAALTVSRSEDRNYLNHVLATARTMAPGTDLQVVVQAADRSWHLSRLDRFPLVREQYLLWEKTQTHPTLDLYLIHSYKGLLKKYTIERYATGTSLGAVPVSWENLSHSLEMGSVSAVEKFAASVAHDTELKAYVLSILSKMINQGRSKRTESFNSAFARARWHVDAQLEDVPAPDQYAAEMRVFTLSGKRDPTQIDSEGRVNPYLLPVAVEVKVSWNAKLGRLESSLVGEIPLTEKRGKLRVADSPRLAHFLQDYFDYFRTGSAYSENEINQHLELEKNASLIRNTYVVFTAPEHPDHAVATARIFNGGPIVFSDPVLNQSQNALTEMQTPIEQTFPHLDLKERHEGIPVREIGRMLANPKETKVNAFPVLMARLADLLYSSGARGAVYFYGVKKVTDHHVREGAEIVFTPEELRLPAAAEPKWVMRMGVQEMAVQYFTQIFETVRLRQPPPTFLVDVPSLEDIVSHVQFNGAPGVQAQATILRDGSSPILLITHKLADDIRYQSALSNAHMGLIADAMSGTESSLSVNSEGNLVIHQQNSSIGRNRWERSLEISYVGGEYVVSRFKLAQFDTLIKNSEDDCDFDLLTGKGTRRGKDVVIATKRLLLKSLTDHEAMYSCLGW